MKKYFLLMALVYALAACTGNSARKNSDDEPEADSFADMMSPDELNRFYEMLFDAFCVKNYDDNLPGKYIQGNRD